MDPVVALQYDAAGNLQYKTALGPWVTVGKELVVAPPVVAPPVPSIYVPDKKKIYYTSVHGNGLWYPFNSSGYGSPEAYAAAIVTNANLWLNRPEPLAEAVAFITDWPGYFTAEFIAKWKSILVGVPVPPPPSPSSTSYTKDDMSPHPFPSGSQYLVDSQSIPTYLQGRCWWLLEEMAKAAGDNLAFLRGCAVSGELPGSTAHRPCNETGGGMMADCKYPVVGESLDVVSFKKMIDQFLEVCCASVPGKEYLDITNESEIRMGSDVFALVGSKYISGGQVNRHIQIDDAFHHRFDDALYPHFHLKWSVMA